MEVEFSGFVRRAKEPDPDKQVYGPGMTAKVLALEGRMQAILEAVEPLREAVDAAAAAALRKRREEEEAARRQQEEEEAARRRELEERARENQRRVEEQKAAEQKEMSTEQAIAAARRGEIDARNAVLAEKLAEAKRKEEEQRKAEEAAAAAREARIEAACRRTPQEGIELLRSQVADKEFVRVVRLLRNIMKCIADEPADPKFRHLRKANERLQRELMQFEYAEDALFAIGFREVQLTQPIPGTYYAFPEADTSDAEAWLGWLDNVRELVTYLTSVLADYSA
mmetsp:Transcript_18800/g.59940  ORF Transcript_18800/g.59940 Transcript_18800/m.59940 type:complete len:283 (-) Transcript_18800:788-1636(-)